MNGLKTVLLLGLLSAVLLVGGEAIAGDRGLATGLLIAVVLLAGELSKVDDPLIALYANLEAVAPRTPDRILPLL